MSDKKFLKELESRIGIRFLMFKDEFHGPNCYVFLFGYTDQTRQKFFWLETSISVIHLGSIKFEIWNDDISGNFRTNLKSWEERHETMSRGTGLTWWDKLLTNKLFTCVYTSSSGVIYERVENISATDPRLHMYYGLLTAHIKGYADDLKKTSDRYRALKGHADVTEVVSKRLNGFVAENHFDRFAIPDEL